MKAATRLTPDLRISKLTSVHILGRGHMFVKWKGAIKLSLMLLTEPSIKTGHILLW